MKDNVKDNVLFNNYDGDIYMISNSILNITDNIIYKVYMM